MTTPRNALVSLLSFALVLALAACPGDDPDPQPCDDVDCGANGSCVTDTGECDCDSGYAGAVCTDCATGFAPSGDSCIAAQCEVAGDCDDGLACNGEESCDATMQCQPGVPVVCSTGACMEPGGLCTDLIADFEDLTLGSESYWSGDATGFDDFVSGDASFINYYDEAFGSAYWEGFAYSNTTDASTGDFTNQYSAITAGGQGGSDTYGVGYLGFNGYEPELRLPSAGAGITLAGAYVTNTTYTYLTIRDGGMFTDPFGGPGGEEPDWYKLIITGITTGDGTSGPVEFYLADYRAGDPTGDYIVGDWSWVDLTALGDVVGLRFALDSSDTGAWGINTPTYFALDSLMRVTD